MALWALHSLPHARFKYNSQIDNKKAYGSDILLPPTSCEALQTRWVILPSSSDGILH